MITVDIKKAFYNENNIVINNFKMKVQRGEIVSIVGQSGAGKSTILKIVAGLHKRFVGKVEIENDARIAIIPQNQSLLPWKTVYENITLLSKASKVSNLNVSVEKENVNELLKLIGLSNYEKSFPNQLSGGQYKRIAFAQACFYEPDILLMDEPFSGLDKETKLEIEDLYLKLHKKNAMTTIFVTHDSEEIEYMKSRKIEI